MTGIHRMNGMTGIPVVTGLTGMTEMTTTRLIPCLTPQSQNKVSHTSLEG